MQFEAVAKALKELGHPKRLLIYKEIVRAGYNGRSVGSVQKLLDIPASTMSHHLSSLASANLIRQRRDGRTIYCIAEYEYLNSVIDFLQSECCIGSDK